ncbi:hypothetical protein C4D60_Mb07t09560 [Musa balbisiana]|uniref:Uncharacterized protein n=1 Tax=Musa balbisiana TaxID=52838 RepID=A0A4S8JE42_MUSBA|nr:hypothetical protein C4D60_Mb07t09560 [Musa balbisiana]
MCPEPASPPRTATPPPRWKASRWSPRLWEPSACDPAKEEEGDSDLERLLNEDADDDLPLGG